MRVAVKAQSLGFRASPHIVDRRIAGESALRGAFGTLRDAGVRQVLLVAGDLQRPVGDFTSTLQILDTGLLQSFGFEQVGVAGQARRVCPAMRRRRFAHLPGKKCGVDGQPGSTGDHPDEMLHGLIRGRALRGSRLVQPHFYAFGGTIATAAWLRAAADGTKFVVNA